MPRYKRPPPLPAIGDYIQCKCLGGGSGASLSASGHGNAIYVCREAPASRSATWSGQLLCTWAQIPESAQKSVPTRGGIPDTLAGELYLTEEWADLSCGDIVEKVSVINGTRWEVDAFQRCSWAIEEGHHFCRRKCVSSVMIRSV